MRLAACMMISVILVHGLLGCRTGPSTAQNEATASNSKAKAAIFADVGGKLHGIAFDNQGHMFVAQNGKTILKVTPDGAYSTFAIVDKASGFYTPGPGDTYVYDLAFGRDGHLYAAAEDRILRIDPRGQVHTVLAEAFTGPWGACGIVLDQEDHIFVSHGSRIIRIRPNGEKTIFIDGEDTVPSLSCIVGLAFDTENQNLWVCDGSRGAGGKLLVFSILGDDSVAAPKVVFASQVYRPEYVCVGPHGEVVFKGPENRAFVLISADGAAKILATDNSVNMEIETLAFGQKGFQPNAVYATAWLDGKIYRLDF